MDVSEQSTFNFLSKHTALVKQLKSIKLRTVTAIISFS